MPTFEGVCRAGALRGQLDVAGWYGNSVVHHAVEQGHACYLSPDLEGLPVKVDEEGGDTLIYGE